MHPMEEMTEYELLELAMVRMDASSSLKHTLIYYIPLWIITILCGAILYIAYYARTIIELRSISADLSAWSSFVMIVVEIVFIAYRHPVQFEWASTLMELALRINVLHAIITASCVAYIKTNGDYSTYFTLIYVFTIPILLLSLTAILRRMYTYS
jgi:hypothetical protein